jgi:hypothetical protein
MMRSRTHRLLLAGMLVLLGALTTHAQVEVDISFRRSLYMVYEPLLCTVTIKNMSGATLDLTDTSREKWFGFQIETTDGRPLPPINPDYRNQAVELAAGQKLTRTINLTPLYPLNEFGTYRVRAAVYCKQFKRYFVSSKLNVNITEGRIIWQKTVGVPEGAGVGRARIYSLLSHRLPKRTMLYLRVEDRENGVIYGTTQLGRFLSFGEPDAEVDSASQIHILQNTAPKAFLYSHFDINGRLLKQQGYQAFDTRPYLVNKDNVVMVIGGVPYDVNAKSPTAELPKIGDRPVPMPTPQGKPTPEDARPKNLLSE